MIKTGKLQNVGSRHLHAKSEKKNAQDPQKGNLRHREKILHGAEEEECLFGGGTKGKARESFPQLLCSLGPPSAGGFRPLLRTQTGLAIV